MLADRQTHRQADRNTPLPYRREVIKALLPLLLLSSSSSSSSSSLLFTNTYLCTSTSWLPISTYSEWWQVGYLSLAVEIPACSPPSQALVVSSSFRSSLVVASKLNKKTHQI